MRDLLKQQREEALQWWWVCDSGQVLNKITRSNWLWILKLLKRAGIFQCQSVQKAFVWWNRKMIRILLARGCTFKLSQTSMSNLRHLPSDIKSLNCISLQSIRSLTILPQLVLLKLICISYRISLISNFWLTSPLGVEVLELCEKLCWVLQGVESSFPSSPRRNRWSQQKIQNGWMVTMK